MNEQEKKDIVSAIEERSAYGPCPRCGQKKFTLLEGYVELRPKQSLSGRLSIFNTPTIPTVMIVCNNCGFMSQHALGILGLLNYED